MKIKDYFTARFMTAMVGLLVMAACNGNANGSVKSSQDTSADTLGKHAPYGKDTLAKKQMDSNSGKIDSAGR